MVCYIHIGRIIIKEEGGGRNNSKTCLELLFLNTQLKQGILVPTILPTERFFNRNCHIVSKHSD